MAEKFQELITNMIEPLLKITPRQLITGIFITLGGINLTKFISRKIKLHYINKNYKSKAEKFRKDRDERLKKFYEENKDLFSKEEKFEITHASLCELKSFLESGKYSSEKIVKVLLLRNYEFLSFNYAADVNIEETINLARNADELRRKIKDSKSEELSKYPLLGLPLSIKDVLLIKNFYITQGFAVNLDLPVNKTDSYVIEVLKERGAIPLIISSIPQGIYAIENENLIFGHAVNPYNKNRIIGGSSGGEAGLISSYCSAAGIGSDIGGSIRIPCNFCGIYGFKPTSLRVSKLNTLEHDNSKVRSPFHLIRVSYGPMARTLNDVILLTQNIIVNYEKDCYNYNIPFDNKILSSINEKKYFKLAILKSDTCKLTEPVDTILKKVTEGLRNNKQNAEFVIEEFPYKNYTEFVTLAFKLMIASKKFDNVLNALKGEYPMEHFRNLTSMSGLSTFSKRVISLLLWLSRSKRMKYFLDNAQTDLSIKEYMDEVRRFEEYKFEFVRIYKENGYDAIISPVCPFPAIKHSHSNELMILINYPLIFNFLDFPAGVIPIAKCGKTSQKYEDDYNDMLTRRIRENLEDCEGLPLGIQVASLANHDELCLGIMKRIDSILREEKIIEKITIVDS